MKEKRIIKVTGLQKPINEETHEIELVTEGTCYEKNENLYIVYEESEISGMEGTTTTLKLEGEDKVVLSRYGTSASQMVFQESKRVNSFYDTLYGQFKMELITHHLDIQVDQDTKRGHIEIHYDLNITGLMESSNKLKIQLM
ncbi:Domain of unknown function DUF1934 [Alkaliphilus metalliredigens QYMF]|uniref:DUF1934 domain-containing protein n=1 Tax=Alkaliphilus metalliredigens (strain QYMF) TaxID=293826 RepID=A6TWU3_ALKMQ|nr:DUF1934 domain-containing protein [Alkaliphilus metalliredigens]ABR50661.1 Domain of unknown function DUF1934 [Alkaliphilus metalliredigens QYMF]